MLEVQAKKCIDQARDEAKKEGMEAVVVTMVEGFIGDEMDAVCLRDMLVYASSQGVAVSFSPKIKS